MDKAKSELYWRCSVVAPWAWGEFFMRPAAVPENFFGHRGRPKAPDRI